MRLAAFLLLTIPLHAETKLFSLKDAIDLALRESPDLILARIEEQKANLAIRIAKDPFRPKIFAGSGLAYSNGFPMSIEGSAPSIVQAKAISSIFNRSYSYRIAQVKEDARTALIDTQLRRDEVALQTAIFFIDAARWARVSEAIKAQVPGLQRTEEVVQLRVKEGRELEIEIRKAALALLKTTHRVDLVERDRDAAEGALASALGLPGQDRVHPVMPGPLAIPIPDSEETAINQAFDDSKDLRRLESLMMAKRHELQQFKSQRLPSVDLVAQYGLFARFNNYEDFFNRFQRNNGQLGVSIQIPLLPSAAGIAQAAQADAELAGLRTKVNQTRAKITLNVQNAFRTLGLMEKSKELARTDLEIAREQVTLTLALWEEGRANQRQLEESRFLEQEKWAAYYDAQFVADRAKLELLKHTGRLLAELQK
jgi:outer membrane protein TolC